MALQSFTITIGALTDAGNNGKNYVNNQPVYIKRTNGTLASIYRDLAGTSQITQDGLSNVTNSKGQFTFFVEAGDYNAEYQSQVTPITVVGADYFNSRIDETVNQIILDLSTSRGFRVRGTFAAGFTYELPNDVGLDASGNAWIYTDVEALPFTVPAATSPSFPTYTQVTFNQASNVSYSENGNVEDALRNRAGYYTLAEAQALDLNVGQTIFIKDLDSHYEVDTGLTPDGFIIIELSPTKQLRRVSFPSQTKAEKTWYVDASATGVQDGSVAKPFRTIQQAWDAIPTIVKHQQTIELANGNYSESSIPDADQPRPAVLWGKGKVTTFRSTLIGDLLTAPILIKGATRNAASVTISTGSSYTYGCYINKGNIGFQNLTISGATSEAETLLTSHRTDTYLHCENIIVDGQAGNANNGVLAESNGQIELANNCHVTGSSINVRTITDGDNITISGSSTVTNATNRNIQVEKGFVKVQLTVGGADLTMISGGASPVFVDTGAVLELRGISGSERVICSDDISSDSGRVELVLSRVTGQVDVNSGASIYYNTSSSTRNVFVRGSSIYLNNANITTTDANSVVLFNGSSIFESGTNTVSGSGGRGVTRNVPNLQFTANGQNQSLLENATRYSIDGAGAQRTGCTLDPTSLPIGETIHFEGSTWGVEIVNSANVDVRGSLTVGNSSGQYTGFCGFVDDTGFFRVTGLGLLNP